MKLQLETYRVVRGGRNRRGAALKRVGILTPLLKVVDDAELQERLARVERILAEDGG